MWFNIIETLIGQINEHRKNTCEFLKLLIDHSLHLLSMFN